MAQNNDQLRADLARVETKVKSFLNNHLRNICKEQGLQISGVKATLQARVISLFTDALSSGDVARFYDLKRKILPPQELDHQPVSTSISRVPQPQHQHQHQLSLSGSTLNGYAAGSSGISMHSSHNMSRVNFKRSPFYSIQEPLSNTITLPAMSSNRHTTSVRFVLSQANVDRLRSHKNLRIMLYCAAEPIISPNPCDIAFPNQLEIRVNNEALQVNLRGVKKKPGTTKPADITDFVRKFQGSVENQIQITYAATEKRYFAVVNLVQKHSVDELVDRIKKGQIISKDTVLNEMRTRAKDPDILATSTVMSLKCPLSFMRMTLPCRSAICNHHQCFDAHSFLELQEQAPQWSCPICNKLFSLSSLAIDQYVQDILATVPKSVDQVTIEPDGSWKQGAHSSEFKAPDASSKNTANLDSDDFFEVQGHRLNGMKAASAYSTPQSFGKSSALSSRETSAQASNASRSNKRKAEEVIDLTLSDDDEPPVRPVKRQSTGSFLAGGTSSGFTQYAQMQPTPSYLPIHNPTQQQLHSPGLPPNSPVQMQPAPQYLYSPQSPHTGFNFPFNNWN